MPQQGSLCPPRATGSLSHWGGSGAVILAVEIQGDVRGVVSPFRTRCFYSVEPQGVRIHVNLQNYWLGHYSHARKRCIASVSSEPLCLWLTAVWHGDRSGWGTVSYFSREECLLCFWKPELLKLHMTNVRTHSEWLWTMQFKNLPRCFCGKHSFSLPEEKEVGTQPDAWWHWFEWCHLCQDQDSLIILGRSAWPRAIGVCC